MSFNSFRVKLCFETHIIVHILCHVGKTVSKTMRRSDGWGLTVVDLAQRERGLTFTLLFLSFLYFFFVDPIFFFLFFSHG